MKCFLTLKRPFLVLVAAYCLVGILTSCEDVMNAVEEETENPTEEGGEDDADDEDEAGDAEEDGASDYAHHEGFGLTNDVVSGSDDWDAVTQQTFGAGYRVADWDDLVEYHDAGGDLLVLFDELGLTDYRSGAFVTCSGDKHYSSTRYYFAERHEHDLPGSFMVHEHIDSHLISLGSWNSTKRLLVVATDDDTPATDGGELDEDPAPTVVTINPEDLSFATGADADWTIVTDDTNGTDTALRSGAITHNQQSRLSTESFTVPTDQTWEFTFSWSISSESNYDYLRFFVNGVEQDAICGEVAWQYMTYEFEPGTYEMEWRYTKDGSVSHGDDAGWVDLGDLDESMLLPPAMTIGIVLNEPGHYTVDFGSFDGVLTEPATVSALISGGGDTYEWLIDGVTETSWTDQDAVTLDPGLIEPGLHLLTVLVEQGGLLYSGSMNFEVRN